MESYFKTILELEFVRNENDKDLWEIFYVELVKRILTISTNYGNFSCKTDYDILQFLENATEDLFLSKISEKTEIDSKKTYENIANKIFEVYGNFFCSDYDLDKIAEICCLKIKENIIKKIMIFTRDIKQIKNITENEFCDLIVTDYPSGAKKVADVFINHIQPKIKELLKREQNDE